MKQAYVCVSIIVIFLLNIATFKYSNASDTTKELLLDSCHNRVLMDYYFKQQDNKIHICDSVVLSYEDYKTIERSIPCYFRFLSIISGLDSPYNFNRQISHYTLSSKDMNYNDENLNIINWYIENQDSITCTLFNEYYQLDAGFMRGPVYRGCDFDEFLLINDAFYDSIECQFDKFIKLHSHKIK